MAPKAKKQQPKDCGDAKLTKEEEAIAKHVRFNCPSKQTMFQGNEVHYFSGQKAVNTLMESKYAKSASGKEPEIASRAAAVAVMQNYLERGLFFRARKLVAKKKEHDHDHGKKAKTDEDENEGTAAEEDDKDKKAEKKKKVKLEVHEIQHFSDTTDVFVWVYDPTPLMKQIIGLLMVVGTIVGCLFPLWPFWLRQAVYYLSLAGIGFLGAIVVIAILRTILFYVLYFGSGGRHRLWVFPNLNEDCGVVESFKPFYTYEYCPDGVSEEERKKKNKKEEKKSKDESGGSKKEKAAAVESSPEPAKKTKEDEKELLAEEEPEPQQEEGEENEDETSQQLDSRRSSGDQGTTTTNTTSNEDEDELTTGGSTGDSQKGRDDDYEEEVHGNQNEEEEEEGPSQEQAVRRRVRPRKEDKFVVVPK